MINAKKTEEFLKNISQRLSGRDDCKKVSYRVTIDITGVHMNPIVQVYPNRHRRKDTDKMDIVSFVHEYRMPKVKLDELVFGEYEYQFSSDQKSRKWRKLNET